VFCREYGQRRGENVPRSLHGESAIDSREDTVLDALEVLGADLWDLRASTEEQLRVLRSAQQLVEQYREGPIGARADARRHLVDQVTRLNQILELLRRAAADVMTTASKLPHT